MTTVESSPTLITQNMIEQFLYREARYLDDRELIHYFNADWARRQAQVDAALPNRMNRWRGGSRDGQKILMRSASDRVISWVWNWSYGTSSYLNVTFGWAAVYWSINLTRASPAWSFVLGTTE